MSTYENEYEPAFRVSVKQGLLERRQMSEVKDGVCNENEGTQTAPQSPSSQLILRALVLGMNEEMSA